jgi:hypothetical protein
MSETCDLLNHSMSFMSDKVESVLANASVAQQVISSVTKTLQNHPLSCAFDSQSGPLRSEAARASFYKNMFNYVEPVSVLLSKSGMPDRFFHYVPIKKTLFALFQDKNIFKHLQAFQLHSLGTGFSVDGKDFNSGTVYQNDKFIQQNPSSLSLVLYQDEFEIANPLGSAKGKHKLFAVYYTVGNLHPSVRSKIDAFQLILLCRHRDLVTYGIHAVMAPVIIVVPHVRNALYS